MKINVYFINRLVSKRAVGKNGILLLYITAQFVFVTSLFLTGMLYEMFQHSEIMSAFGK